MTDEEKLARDIILDAMFKAHRAGIPVRTFAREMVASACIGALGPRLVRRGANVTREEMHQIVDEEFTREEVARSGN